MLLYHIFIYVVHPKSCAHDRRFVVYCCAFMPAAFTHIIPGTLRWRHNGRDGVSNHQPHDCLLKRSSSADQTKHQSSASLAFVRGIHRWPVNFPHKWPVTRKMFTFDDVIVNMGNPNETKNNRTLYLFDRKYLYTKVCICVAYMDTFPLFHRWVSARKT